MAQEQASLSIPMDLLKPAIDAKIQTAILEALGGSDSIMEKVIAEVLNHKVDSSGSPERYPDKNSKPWFQWAIENAVRDAVKAALNQHFATRTDEIKAALLAEIGKKNSKLARDFVSGMATGMASLVNGYRMTVSFYENR